MALLREDQVGESTRRLDTQGVHVRSVGCHVLESRLFFKNLLLFTRCCKLRLRTSDLGDDSAKGSAWKGSERPVGWKMLHCPFGSDGKGD